MYILLICCVATVCAQVPPVQNNDELPLRKHIWLLQQAKYAAATSANISKLQSNSTVFDTSKWASRIDAAWGQGADLGTKLALLRQMWDTLNYTYSAFVQLPNYNWDSLVAQKESEVNRGVSRGRFAAIINDLMRYINDGHSSFYDVAVDYGNSIYQGLPLFRGESGLFGACITTLNDSIAMVYDAVPDHPFGLVVGDIILGYNGIPWSELVRTIIKHQLPNACYIGSTDAATFHREIQAAGENWYLFDTVNIKKCNGTLVNLPTSLMLGHNYSQFCTEQMPLAGVHKVTLDEYYSGKIVSYGILAGTRIGYVYMYDCSDVTGDSLYNAVRTLVEDSSAKGIIIDIRTNYGGYFGAFEKTFQYLYSGDVEWIGVGDRSDPNNRLAMANYGDPAWYTVYDTDPHYYNNPVAILCGPNAVSAGDLLSVLFKHDPFVKTFGKSTGGAFGGYQQITLIDSVNFGASRQSGDFFQVSNPTYYLSHTEFPIDFPLWFDQDSVCNGKDNIVSAAVQWINASTNSVQDNMIATTPELDVAPNPSSGVFHIGVISPAGTIVTVRLCNVLGTTIWSSKQDVTIGKNTISCNIPQHDLPNGLYFVHVDGLKQNTLVSKLIIAK